MTADTCAAGHGYARVKRIRPHGARVKFDRLLVPVRGVEGTLHGLQFIAPDGVKQVKPGTE